MAKSVRLPMIPEPILTDEEKKALAEVYGDPAFWEWLESMPVPTDDGVDVVVSG